MFLQKEDFKSSGAVSEAPLGRQKFLSVPYRGVQVCARIECGTMCSAWKVTEDVDQTSVSRTIPKLNSSQQVYATRAMRKEFLDKYNNLCKIPSIILSFSVSSKPMECMTPNFDGLSQRKKAEGSVRRGVI